MLSYLVCSKLQVIDHQVKLTPSEHFCLVHPIFCKVLPNGDRKVFLNLNYTNCLHLYFWWAILPFFFSEEDSLIFTFANTENNEWKSLWDEFFNWSSCRKCFSIHVRDELVGRGCTCCELDGTLPIFSAVSSSCKNVGWDDKGTIQLSLETKRFVEQLLQFTIVVWLIEIESSKFISTMP